MKEILVITFILIQEISFCQIKFIELSNNPININADNFYISEVIDSRDNKNNIGFSYVGVFNKKVKLHITDGIEKTFLRILNSSLPSEPNKTPIVIKIVHLDVSEVLAFPTETGRVELGLEFYKYVDGKPGKIYETEAFIEEPGKDVSKGQEKRIREVLTTCIKNFNESQWESTIPIFEEQKITNTIDNNFSQKNKETKRWNSLLSFNKTWGINAEGWGITYYGYTKNEKSDWIIPRVIAIEKFTIYPSYFNQFNYQKADLNYVMPGLCAFKKLDDELYLNFTLLVPIGNENVIDLYGNKSNLFLFGIASMQGLYIITDSKFGIIIGFGIYEKVLASKVYKSDIGIKAEIGIKF